jgi:hypothetical protein
MKFTQAETRFINALIANGGSIAPDAGYKLKAEDHKTAKRLERRGVVTIEQVDTGERFSLREGV